MVEGKTNSRFDGIKEPAEGGCRNAQADAIITTQIASPPKTLSKSARKKANRKQNKAIQKERQRKDAAVIEAAIREEAEKQQQLTLLQELAVSDVMNLQCQNSECASNLH